MAYPKRGEIYLVNLDPTIGSEIKKTRPAVIIQNNTLNRYSPLTVICPITSNVSKGVTRVLIQSPAGGLEKDSVVLTQQIRCIDKKSLIKRIGKLEEKLLHQIGLALKVVEGLLPH